MAGNSDLLTLDVFCDRAAPAEVRAALADVHRDNWSLDDGLLVASELVTNAVRHSGCDPGHRLKVTVSLRRDALLISVHDPGLSGDGAKRTKPEDREAGGWGLRIIDRLARQWGAERPDGYLVWAELAAAPG